MSQDSIPGEPTLWSRPAKEAGVRGMVSIVSQDSIPQKQPPFISDPHLSRVYDLSCMHYGQGGKGWYAVCQISERFHNKDN